MALSGDALTRNLMDEAGVALPDPSLGLKPDPKLAEGKRPGPSPMPTPLNPGPNLDQDGKLDYYLVHDLDRNHVPAYAQAPEDSDAAAAGWPASSYV